MCPLRARQRKILAARYDRPANGHGRLVDIDVHIVANEYNLHNNSEYMI